jgi:Family of unknown function (DUF6286)
MTRRPRRVIPACLTALAILALSVVAAVALVQELAGRPALVPLGALVRHTRTLRLDSPVMVIAAAVSAGLGLILLGCAAIPGRAVTLPLAAVTGEHSDGQPGAGTYPVAGVSRSGLRIALAATVADVDGVAAVRVRLRGRRVSARVRTELSGTAALHEAVSRAAEDRLRQSGLARPPAVLIRVRHLHRRASA